MNAQDAFSKLNNATRKAFGSVSKASGVSIDPDVRLYRTLGQNEFTMIMKKYGADETVRYIQEMEAKQMMGGKHAK